MFVKENPDRKKNKKNLGNGMQAIQFENVGLKGKAQAKDQEKATLQRPHLGHLEKWG